MKTKFFIIFTVIVILIIGGLGVFMNRSKFSSPKYDAFAQCLSDSGAKFYGTFWCTHCQNQKKLFGSSKQYLPYVECSTPDGQNQTQICKDKNIEGYPTWIFKDETRLSGEIPLETLAEKTQCVLPQ